MKNSNISKSPDRRDRLIEQHVHDPYRMPHKPKGTLHCPDCGAVYADGRWAWGEPPANAESRTCQACHRMKDNQAAGEITLSGDFVASHRDELINLVRNVAETARQAHPMQRVIGIADRDGGLFITTTDVHLARRIGEAVSHAYKGDFDYRYDEDDYFLAGAWIRNG